MGHHRVRRADPVVSLGVAAPYLTGVRFSLLYGAAKAAENFLNISCVSGARSSSGVITVCKHLEKLVLALGAGDGIGEHHVQGVRAHQLGRLVDLEVPELLLESRVRRLRNAGPQLRQQLFEHRSLIRLDLDQQEAGRRRK